MIAIVRNGPFWALSFFLPLAFFFLAYRHSHFFGWTHPKGGEPVLLSLLALGILLLLFASLDSLTSMLAILFFFSGSVLGFLSPWSTSGSPYWAQEQLPKPEQVWEIKRVAHAGGVIEGLRGSNTLEALEANKNYFDFFEVDFSLTSDGKLVCLHGWGEKIHSQIFGEVLSEPIPFSRFRQLNVRHDESKLTACDLASLKNWLSDNPDKKIITDIKSDKNIFHLGQMIEGLGTTSNQVIPQIYDSAEIEDAISLGFERVILTSYRMNEQEFSSALTTVSKDNLFAVTINKERVTRHIDQLLQLDVPIYAHTVNELSTFAFLRSIGVSNIYTDTLIDTTDGY